MRYNPVEGSREVKGVFIEYSWVFFVFWGVVLYGGTQKLAYFPNEIRKNCIYFGGFRQTGILSDTKIVYFEGRNTAKFQSYGH